MRRGVSTAARGGVASQGQHVSMQTTLLLCFGTYRGRRETRSSMLFASLHHHGLRCRAAPSYWFGQSLRVSYSARVCTCHHVITQALPNPQSL